MCRKLFSRFLTALGLSPPSQYTDLRIQGSSYPVCLRNQQPLVGMGILGLLMASGVPLVETERSNCKCDTGTWFVGRLHLNLAKIIAVSHLPAFHSLPDARSAVLPTPLLLVFVG